MKKILTLATFAVLTSTSLGQAVKFDPLTGTIEEYASKTKKLTMKLGNPKLSPESFEAIQEQLFALIQITEYKFRPGQIAGEKFIQMAEAYDKYCNRKIKRFEEHYNEPAAKVFE